MLCYTTYRFYSKRPRRDGVERVLLKNNIFRMAGAVYYLSWMEIMSQYQRCLQYRAHDNLSCGSCFRTYVRFVHRRRETEEESTTLFLLSGLSKH